MDVDSFLGGLRVQSASQVAVKSTAVIVEPPPEASDLTKDITPSERDSVSRGGGDIVTDVTPSGIEVAYQSRPKRLYMVRQGFRSESGDGGGHTDWREVPSVTTVLDLLNKGGLTIWGMRVGIQGVLTLFERGHLATEFDWENERERVVVPLGQPASPELVEGLLKLEGLTTNDAKDSAAGRGNIVHQALEDWAKTGTLPVVDNFDKREQGYVEGLVKFLEDADPTPVRTEVMVGSVEHGFAGRYDLELQLTETKKLRKTPKQKWHDVPAGIYLTDCKSSKGVYPSTHFRQLAAYEAARVECGYPATDGQYVLNVNGEGSYAFVRSTAVLEDFLAVLSVYQSDANMKEAA